MVPVPEVPDTGEQHGHAVLIGGADHFLVARCRVVQLGALRDHLPADTTTLGADERRAVLEARREGLRRRWRMPFTRPPEAAG